MGQEMGETAWGRGGKEGGSGLGGRVQKQWGTLNPDSLPWHACTDQLGQAPAIELTPGQGNWCSEAISG